MADRKFVLKMGDGNDGSFPRAIINLGENDCPYAFAEMAIANIFIAGTKTRSFVYKNTIVDGEEDYTIYATLHEGAHGETAMGAAYKTAEMSLLVNDWYDDLHEYSVKEWLDRSTLTRYKKIMAKNK